MKVLAECNDRQWSLTPWGCNSVVECSLCMRKVQGSNPCSSIIFALFALFALRKREGEHNETSSHLFFISAYLCSLHHHFTRCDQSIKIFITLYFRIFPSSWILNISINSSIGSCWRASFFALMTEDVIKNYPSLLVLRSLLRLFLKVVSFTSKSG